MTDFLQLCLYLLAAVNPAAAAIAAPRDRRPGFPVVALGAVVAFGLLATAAVLADPFLDGLDVEPETFRVAAGVVLLIGGGLAIWTGGAAHSGPWEGWKAGIFPLAVPVLATPAALAAAISYAADRGPGEAAAAAGVAVFAAGSLFAARAGRFESALDAIARVTGVLLVAVAAGLIVDGVRAI